MHAADIALLLIDALADGFLSGLAGSGRCLALLFSAVMTLSYHLQCPPPPPVAGELGFFSSITLKLRPI
jgi:hypothetical protein